jgi:hypothetical protein
MINDLWKEIKPRDPQPPWIYSDGNGELIVTGQFENYRGIYSDKVMDTLSYFKDFPITYTKILTNADFANGTYRIQTSGYYVLGEDITFDPNPDNDSQPTQQQLEGEYSGGPYTLGFFAAITVEAPDVIINLNGKILKQSKRHHLKQRFYAHIELASSPFIPSQGPANFGPTIVAANRLWITNGNLGLSSHHGIHGNDMTNVVIENLNVYDYEVGAISLNGGTHILTRNVNVSNVLNEIRVVSSFSQCRFIRPFLQKIIDHDPTYSVVLDGVSYTATDISINLQKELDEAYDTIVNQNSDLPESSLFYNKTKKSDCDCYGFLFNSRGVAVNGFKVNREGAIGNVDITVHDCNINKLKTTAQEIIGISKAKNIDRQIGAYGSGEQAGPVGDIFNVLYNSDASGNYKRNSLGDAQIIVSAFSLDNSGISMGTAGIKQEVINWAAGGTSLSSIVDNISDDKYYFVNNHDSMGHVMKGNIGLFLSAVKDCKIYNVNINIVNNSGDCGSTKHGDIAYEGSSNRGVGIFGSESVNLLNVKVVESDSHNGCSYGVHVGTESKNISLANISVNGMESCPATASEGSPNPEPKPHLFLIGDQTNNVRII